MKLSFTQKIFNVFATMEDAMEQVKEDMETTYQILQDECCIPINFFQRPEWDKLLIAGLMIGIVYLPNFIQIYMRKLRR